MGLDPAHASTHRSSSHAVVASHIQNRGRLAQMLAQGHSFSPKKKKKLMLYIFEIFMDQQMSFIILVLKHFKK